MRSAFYVGYRLYVYKPFYFNGCYRYTLPIRKKIKFAWQFWCRPPTPNLIQIHLVVLEMKNAQRTYSPISCKSVHKTLKKMGFLTWAAEELSIDQWKFCSKAPSSYLDSSITMIMIINTAAKLVLHSAPHRERCAPDAMPPGFWSAIQFPLHLLCRRNTHGMFYSGNENSTCTNSAQKECSNRRV
jgi:hypothetical protein